MAYGCALTLADTRYMPILLDMVSIKYNCVDAKITTDIDRFDQHQGGAQRKLLAQRRSLYSLLSICFISTSKVNDYLGLHRLSSLSFQSDEDKFHFSPRLSGAISLVCKHPSSRPWRYSRLLGRPIHTGYSQCSLIRLPSGCVSWD